MKPNRIITLIIKILETEKRKHAVTASMYEKFGFDVPSAINAHEKRVQIDEAIKWLKGIKE